MRRALRERDVVPTALFFRVDVGPLYFVSATLSHEGRWVEANEAVSASVADAANECCVQPACGAHAQHDIGHVLRALVLVAGRCRLQLRSKVGRLRPAVAGRLQLRLLSVAVLPLKQEAHLEVVSGRHFVTYAGERIISAAGKELLWLWVPCECQSCGSAFGSIRLYAASKGSVLRLLRCEQVEFAVLNVVHYTGVSSAEASGASSNVGLCWQHALGLRAHNRISRSNCHVRFDDRSISAGLPAMLSF